jgi:hypothetical protein
MNRTIVARPNQSMLDVIIQAMGSIEGGIQFCTLNNVSISDTPVVGTEYVIPETDATNTYQDKNVLKYLGQNAIVIGTLGTAVPEPPPPMPLSMMVVLKPILAATYTSVVAPDVLGYYPIALDDTVDFLNINSLAAVYPGGNGLHYQNASGMLAGTPAPVANETGGLSMTTKHLEYQIPWAGPIGDIWVWNAHPSLRTVTFEDVYGNRACAAPLIVLYDHSVGISEYLIADLDVDFVSSDGYTATLRLTRNHAATAHINMTPPYGHITMQWIPMASAPYTDPAHAGNTNIQLVDLPPGKHTIGVISHYVNDIIHVTWPAYSVCTQVIEVF